MYTRQLVLKAVSKVFRWCQAQSLENNRFLTWILKSSMAWSHSNCFILQTHSAFHHQNHLKLQIQILGSHVWFIVIIVLVSGTQESVFKSPNWLWWSVGLETIILHKPFPKYHLYSHFCDLARCHVPHFSWLLSISTHHSSFFFNICLFIWLHWVLFVTHRIFELHCGKWILS